MRDEASMYFRDKNRDHLLCSVGETVGEGTLHVSHTHCHARLGGDAVVSMSMRSIKVAMMMMLSVCGVCVRVRECEKDEIMAIVSWGSLSSLLRLGSGDALSSKEEKKERKKKEPNITNKPNGRPPPFCEFMPPRTSNIKNILKTYPTFHFSFFLFHHFPSSPHPDHVDHPRNHRH